MDGKDTEMKNEKNELKYSLLHRQLMKEKMNMEIMKTKIKELKKEIQKWKDIYYDRDNQYNNIFAENLALRSEITILKGEICYV